LRVLVRERYLDCVLEFPASAPEEEFNAGVCRTPGVRVAVPAAPWNNGVFIDNIMHRSLQRWRPECETKKAHRNGTLVNIGARPRAFSIAEAGPPSEGEAIDRQLNVGVRFFACIWFVVEDVNVSVADLQEIGAVGSPLEM